MGEVEGQQRGEIGREVEEHPPRGAALDDETAQSHGRAGEGRGSGVEAETPAKGIGTDEGAEEEQEGQELHAREVMSEEDAARGEGEVGERVEHRALPEREVDRTAMFEEVVQGEVSAGRGLQVVEEVGQEEGPVVVLEEPVGMVPFQQGKASQDHEQAEARHRR